MLSFVSFLLFILQTLFQPAAARTSKRAVMASNFKELCTLAGQLKVAHTYAYAKLSTAKEFLSELQKLHDQAAVAAQATKDVTDSKLFQAVALAIREMIDTQAKQLPKLAAKGLTLALRAGLVAGRTTEFMSLLSQFSHTPGANGGCILTTDTGASTGTWTGLQENLQGCDNTKVADLASTSNGQRPEINFKAVQAKSDIQDPTTFTVTGCTMLGDPDTEADLPGGLAAKADTLYYAAGAIKITGTPAIQIQGMTDLGSSTGQDRFKEAEEALTALDGEETTEARNAAEKIHEKLLSDDLFLQAAATIISNSSKTGAQVKADNALMAAIKARIGVTPAKFKDPFLKNMQATATPKIPTWGISFTGNKLSGMDTTDQASRLLQYYNSQPRAEADTSACQPQSVPSKDGAANQKICDEFHDKPKECPDKTCTYDTNANKWNPIKPVEGTPTVSGEGTGEVKKCKGKPEQDCGDGCKWDGKNAKIPLF
uniref:Variant surface glycoprotein 1125.1096 n=1 Tax=Trypanosoma brucei TaxID=5691 RepID=A0A1J0R685_9TRYP|nr:variant surface glycoprotein 1125.1096 [Trypanosoma brucei]